MKQTGVIRKIDELGRIVLPKEIRKNLGIYDGESLEIFVDEKGVYLQKYSKILDLKDVADSLCEIFFNNFKMDMLVIDREKIVSSSNSALINGCVPSVVAHFMEDRESYESVCEESFFDVSLNGYFLMKPIIIDTDCLGMIILYKQSSFLPIEKNILNFCLEIFNKKIDKG